MSVKNFKKELLEDTEFKKVYEDTDDLAFEISEMILDLRLDLGLTQKQLAKKMGTRQSSIARAERGKHLPSLAFLKKIAIATDTELITPKFVLTENNCAV